MKLDITAVVFPAATRYSTLQHTAARCNIHCIYVSTAHCNRLSWLFSRVPSLQKTTFAVTSATALLSLSDSVYRSLRRRAPVRQKRVMIAPQRFSVERQLERQNTLTFDVHTYISIQPIAFDVSFNLNLQSQSYWSLFNGTWQKKSRALDHQLRFERQETTLQMQQAVRVHHTHLHRTFPRLKLESI